MRHIPKGVEPSALTTYRERADARYDGDSGFPPVKDAIREALVREQRGLCCYCEQRIAPSEGRMRVEHRTPQSMDRGRDLDWRNLLGACCGGEGSAEVHCDVAKGDREVDLDPTQEAHTATLSFTAGRLCSTRAAFQRDVDDVLRLNCDTLVDRRQRALDAYVRARTAGYAGSIRRETFERWLADIDQPARGGALPPFASFLRAWLSREIRRRSKPAT